MGMPESAMQEQSSAGDSSGDSQHGASQQSKSNRGTSGRFSRKYLLAAAIVLLWAVTVYFAYSQKPYPNPLTPPAKFTAGWFYYPMEVNPELRLSAVGGHLYAITVVPEKGKNKTVVAVGSKGQIVYSNDQGTAWTQAKFLDDEIKVAFPKPIKKAEYSPATRSSSLVRAATPNRILPNTTHQFVSYHQEKAPSLEKKNPKEDFDPSSQQLPPEDSKNAGRAENTSDLSPGDLSSKTGPQPANSNGNENSNLAGGLTNAGEREANIVDVHIDEYGVGCALGVVSNQASQKFFVLFLTQDFGKSWSHFSWQSEFSLLPGWKCDIEIATSNNPGSYDFKFSFENGAIYENKNGTLSGATRKPLKVSFSRKINAKAAENNGPSNSVPEPPTPANIDSGDASTIVPLSASDLLRQPLPDTIPVGLRNYLADPVRGWPGRWTGHYWDVEDKVLWICGNYGLVVRSEQEGETLRQVTRSSMTQEYGKWVEKQDDRKYMSYPAPWFYLLSLGLLIGLIVTLRYRPKDEHQNEPVKNSVANVFVTDKPIVSTSQDQLGFKELAFAISSFIRNDQTSAPLSIAVQGPWGQGKSSLLRMIEEDLKKNFQRCIWFNAWHHQRGENLLANLLQLIKRRAAPNFFHPHFLEYRIRLAMQRVYDRRSLGLLAIMAFCFGYLYHEYSLLDQSRPILPQVFSFNFDVAAGDSVLSAVAGVVKPIGLSGTALISLIFFVARLARAFVSDPSSLLSSSANKQDLTARSVFFSRFESDFRGFTENLSPYRLCLFIDDLDRCEPKALLEVVEGVNFLMSSGDCFVIMAMDKERVVERLGVALRQSMGLSETSNSVKMPQEVADYIEHFMEKIVNVSVDVPVATPNQLQEALFAKAETFKKKTPQKTIGSWWVSEEAWSRLYLPVIFVVALLGIIIFGPRWGAATSQDYHAERVRREAEAETKTKKPEAPKATELRELVDWLKGIDYRIVNFIWGKKKNPDSLVAMDDGTSTPIVWAQDEVKSDLVPGSSSRGYLFEVGLIGFGLIAAGLWLFRQRSIPKQAFTTDSNELRENLAKWLPLLRLRAKTPRALKALLNAIRFDSIRGLQSDTTQKSTSADFANPPSIQTLVTRRCLVYLNEDKEIGEMRRRFAEGELNNLNPDLNESFLWARAEEKSSGTTT